MTKRPLISFSLPLISLTGHPFKFDDTDKLFWVPYEYEGPEFPLQNLKLLDSGREVEVKKVKTQGERKLFQFKGIPEKGLFPGLQLFSTTWPVTWENKAFFVPLGAANKKLSPGKVRIKGQLFGELGAEADFKTVPGPGEKYLIQVSFKRRIPLLIGTVALLVTEKNEEVEAALLTPGLLEPRDIQDLVTKTFRFPGNPSLQALYSINLRLKGYVLLPPDLQDSTFEETTGDGPVRFMTKARAFFTGKVISMVSQPGGASRAALEEKLKLPSEILSWLLLQMTQENKLLLKEGYYLPTGDPKSYLSPLAKGLLEKLEKAGTAGIFIPDERAEVLQNTYRALARMGLAVLTEEEHVYSPSAYQSMIKILCGTGTIGKEYRIAEMKDLLGLARAQMLGLLHKMEEDGWLSWKEDHREVLKEWTDSL